MAWFFAGGSVALIIYQIFKHLSAKWLDAKFDERLQALKHQQDKEVEQLRFKIAALLDRATKLHEREYEVLPEAWSKLNDAFWNVRGFVSPLQSYPDIDRMAQPQQDDFIDNCCLTEWQKSELRIEKDKNKYYQDNIFWHDFSNVQTKSQEATTYLIKKGIFITDDIRTKFNIISDLIWDALIEHKGNKVHNIHPRDRSHIVKLCDEGENLIKDLERRIHKKLWPTDEGL